jgi:hypothetical protein
MSIQELANKTPVKPPTVNKKMKPNDHSIGASNVTVEPVNVASQLNTLTPVGIAMIIVADVK